MRARESESLLVLPLLPIFFLGAFPILLLGLLGFIGLGIIGVLMISVGLTDGLEAHGEFNGHIIVDGYTRRSERTIQAQDLQSRMRFAMLMIVAGIAVVIAGGLGFLYFG